MMKIVLQNIGRIKNASLFIDGITVVAGKNNTGKSTLGRVLACPYHSVSRKQDAIVAEKKEAVLRVLKAITSPAGNTACPIDKIVEFCLESKKEFAKRKVDFLAILNQYLGCHATSRTTRFFKDKLWEIMQFEDSQIACAWVRACFEKEFHHQILSLNDPKAGSIALDVDGISIHADFKD